MWIFRFFSLVLLVRLFQGFVIVKSILRTKLVVEQSILQSAEYSSAVSSVQYSCSWAVLRERRIQNKQMIFQVGLTKVWKMSKKQKITNFFHRTTSRQTSVSSDAVDNGNNDSKTTSMEVEAEGSGENSKIESDQHRDEIRTGSGPEKSGFFLKFEVRTI